MELYSHITMNIIKDVQFQVYMLTNVFSTKSRPCFPHSKSCTHTISTGASSFFQMNICQILFIDLPLKIVSISSVHEKVKTLQINLLSFQREGVHASRCRSRCRRSFFCFFLFLFLSCRLFPLFPDDGETGEVSFGLVCLSC